MKVAILEAKQGERNPENSITVAYRNLLVLKRYFNADMYVSASELQRAPDDYDIIICGFSSTSTERDESTKFLLRNKRAHIFRMIGEYEQVSVFAPLFYSKKPYHIIRNFEHKTKFESLSETFLNINLLLSKAPPSKPTPKKYANIYYGRWREDREVYANRYLQKGTLLSTSPKNMKRYLAAGCNATMAAPLTWDDGRENLQLFATSLYLEDVFTHSHYNCPANRFYEALFCDTVVLSQPEATNTWQRAGINLGVDRIVAGADDYVDLSNRILSDAALRGRYLDEQRGWAHDAVIQRAQLLADIRQLFVSVL